MDLNELVSKLLDDGGGRQFLASCFLLLEPKDLKACRLVCSSWNVFIKDDVWVEFRSRLKRKLVEQWKSTDYDLTRPARWFPKEVTSLFVNDTHIFCEHSGGLGIAVHSLENAAWTKDLVPSVEKPDDCGSLNFKIPLAGGEGIVASIAWNKIATLWSSKGEMEQLNL